MLSFPDVVWLIPPVSLPLLEPFSPVEPELFVDPFWAFVEGLRERRFFLGLESCEPESSSETDPLSEWPSWMPAPGLATALVPLIWAVSVPAAIRGNRIWFSYLKLDGRLGSCCQANNLLVKFSASSTPPGPPKQPSFCYTAAKVGGRVPIRNRYAGESRGAAPFFLCFPEAERHVGATFGWLFLVLD